MGKHLLGFPNRYFHMCLPKLEKITSHHSWKHCIHLYWILLFMYCNVNLFFKVIMNNVTGRRF